MGLRGIAGECPGGCPPATEGGTCGRDASKDWRPSLTEAWPSPCWGKHCTTQSAIASPPCADCPTSRLGQAAALTSCSRQDRAPRCIDPCGEAGASPRMPTRSTIASSALAVAASDHRDRRIDPSPRIASRPACVCAHPPRSAPAPPLPQLFALSFAAVVAPGSHMPHDGDADGGELIHSLLQRAADDPKFAPLKCKRLSQSAMGEGLG